MRKWLIPLCGAVVACNGVNLPKEQQLGGFRILGIQASAPEVSVGSLPTVVQLTPVLSDLNGGGRAIAITGVACVDVGFVTGSAPSCEGVPGKTDLVIPTFTPGAAAANSQSFGSPSYTGALPTIAVTVPTGVTAGRSAVDQYNGVGYLVILTFTAGDRVISASKKILVSTRPAAHANPDLTAILANGAALATLPTGEVNLTATVTDNLTYDYMDQSGTVKTLTKKLEVAYFTTDGELKQAAVEPNQNDKWIPPGTAPAGRPATIVAVVYDFFGGMDFLIRDL